MDEEARRVTELFAAKERATALPLEDLLATQAWLEHAFLNGVDLEQTQEYVAVKERLRPQIESALLLKNQGSSMASDYVEMLLRIGDTFAEKEKLFTRYSGLVCDEMGRRLEDGLGPASEYLKEQRPLLTLAGQDDTIKDLETVLDVRAERTRRSLREESVRANKLALIDDVRQDYAARMESSLGSYEQKTAELQEDYTHLVNKKDGRCSQDEAKGLFDRVKLHAEEGRHVSEELGKRHLPVLEERAQGSADEAIRLEHQAGILYDNAHTDWKHKLLVRAEKTAVIVVIGLATLKASFYIPQIIDAWKYRQRPAVTKQQPTEQSVKPPAKSTIDAPRMLPQHETKQENPIMRMPLEAQLLAQSYAAQHQGGSTVPSQRFAVYITQRGDSLSKIRQELYHDKKWQKLLDANKGMVDNQLCWVYPGQPLILPEQGLVDRGQVTYVTLSSRQAAATQREGRLAVPLYRAPRNMSYEQVSRDLTGTTSYSARIRDASGGVNRVLGERIRANDYVSLPSNIPISNTARLVGAGR